MASLIQSLPSSLHSLAWTSILLLQQPPKTSHRETSRCRRDCLPQWTKRKKCECIVTWRFDLVTNWFFFWFWLVGEEAMIANFCSEGLFVKAGSSYSITWWLRAPVASPPPTLEGKHHVTRKNPKLEFICMTFVCFELICIICRYGLNWWSYPRLASNSPCSPG